MSQSRSGELLEPVVVHLGRSGGPSSFTVEVISDLKAMQAEGTTRTEALRQDHARSSEESRVSGVESVKGLGHHS